jgi:hypothetical protein
VRPYENQTKAKRLGGEDMVEVAKCLPSKQETELNSPLPQRKREGRRRKRERRRERERERENMVQQSSRYGSRYWHGYLNEPH